MFKELKRIALGEFFDDIDLAVRLTSFFGLDTDKGEYLEEKTGMDRLGEDSFVNNFGATLIIGTTLFILLVLVIVLLSYYRKKFNLS